MALLARTRRTLLHRNVRLRSMRALVLPVKACSKNGQRTCPTSPSARIWPLTRSAIQRCSDMIWSVIFIEVSSITSLRCVATQWIAFRNTATFMKSHLNSLEHFISFRISAIIVVGEEVGTLRHVSTNTDFTRAAMLYTSGQFRLHVVTKFSFRMVAVMILLPTGSVWPSNYGRDGL